MATPPPSLATPGAHAPAGAGGDGGGGPSDDEDAAEGEDGPDVRGAGPPGGDGGDDDPEGAHFPDVASAAEPAYRLPFRATLTKTLLSSAHDIAKLKSIRSLAAFRKFGNDLAI